MWTPTSWLWRTATETTTQRSPTTFSFSRLQGKWTLAILQEVERPTSQPHMIIFDPVMDNPPERMERVMHATKSMGACLRHMKGMHTNPSAHWDKPAISIYTLYCKESRNTSGIRCVQMSEAWLKQDEWELQPKPRLKVESLYKFWFGDLYYFNQGTQIWRPTPNGTAEAQSFGEPWDVAHRRYFDEWETEGAWLGPWSKQKAKGQGRCSFPEMIGKRIHWAEYNTFRLVGDDWDTEDDQHRD